MGQILDERKQEETRELLSDYTKVRERLFIRLYNREVLGPALDELVHRDFLEFAITCCIDISHILGMGASVPVGHGLAAAIGVEEEQLVEDAMESSPAVKPAEVVHMDDMMEKLTGFSPWGEEGRPEKAASPLYVVTTEGLRYGAAAVLYPSVLDKLAEELGSRTLLLIPSSVHEVLALGADAGMQKEELEALIREVNMDQVPEKERLSDRLYCYDRETGEIKRA